MVAATVAGHPHSGTIRSFLFFFLERSSTERLMEFKSWRNSSVPACSIPSRASARKGSLNAAFSRACISAGDSSPFKYFSISCLRLPMAFHADFQVSFSILYITLDLVQIVTRYLCYLLVAFLLKIEQAHTLLLFMAQRLYTSFKSSEIRFNFDAMIVMSIATRFHKL